MLRGPGLPIDYRFVGMPRQWSCLGLSLRTHCSSRTSSSLPVCTSYCRAIFDQILLLYTGDSLAVRIEITTASYAEYWLLRFSDAVVLLRFAIPD